MSHLAVLILLLFFSSVALAQENPTPDWTSRAEVLGSPFKDRYPDGELIYARNVWTMAPYQGKLYFGAGGYDNSPPAANAGPVPIIAFDPATKTFQKEWDVPDEQIDVYRIFSDGLLYAPGIDPREGWDLGNFYRKKQDGAWEKVRTFPKGVHNLDMAEFDGKLFCGCYGIGISSDWGATMVLREVGGYRVHSFLTFPNVLYAASEIRYQKTEYNETPCAMLHRYNPQTNDFEPANLPIDDVLPDSPLEFAPSPEQPITACLKRATPFQGRVLYLARRYRTKSSAHIKMKPFGAYSASADADGAIKAIRVPLPEDAIVQNFTTTEKTAAADPAVFVLFYQKIQEDKDAAAEEVLNSVWKSADGITFSPLFSFKAPTLARSFAFLDGYFYFGLGTDIPRNPETGAWTGKGLKEASGEIWRFPADAL